MHNGTTKYQTLISIIRQAPRLLDLYSPQIKMLPGNQLEQIDFLKAVAIEIKRHSEPDDIIVSPLPKAATSLVIIPGERYFSGKIKYHMQAI